jgi:hypothetical protein
LSSLPIPQSNLYSTSVVRQTGKRAQEGRGSVIEKKKEKGEKTLAHDERSIDAFG